MIGKDIFIQNHKFQLKQGDNKLVVFQSHGARKTLSFFGALSIIFNLLITDDPFFMPYYFQCGLTKSIIITIIIFVLNLLSFMIYFKTWIFGNAFSYEGITSIAISRNLAIFISIIIIFSFICISVDMSQSIPYYFVDLFSLSSKCPSILLNKWFLYYIINFLTVFPSLFNKSIASFNIISTIGNFFLIISIIFFFIGFASNRPLKFEATHDSRKFQFDANCIKGITNMFFINPILYLITTNMTSPSTKSITGIVIITNLASVIASLSVGIVGYFYHSNIENILDLLPRKSAYTIIAKIGLIIKLISSNMCYVYIISSRVCELILKGSEKWPVAVVTAGVVIITLNAIKLFSKFNIFFSVVILISFIFQCFLNFGFPTIFFLKLFQFSSKPWAITSIVLLIITIFLCVICGISAYFILD